MLVTDRISERQAAAPLEIRASGDTVAITMRTPGHDRELALGFLLAKGVIESARDVATVTHCGRVGDESRHNTIDVRAAPGMAFDVERVEQTIDELIARCAPVDRGVRVALSVIAGGVATLEARQPSHTRISGLHGAALLDATGAVLTAHEDFGRHNAVDKAVGAWLVRAELDKPVGTPALLVVSDRVSVEMVHEAARARVGVVCGASAPTSLAVDVASALGITLAAFVRPRGLKVYTHTQLLDLDR
jgi:FdhD protein